MMFGPMMGAARAYQRANEEHASPFACTAQVKVHGKTVQCDGDLLRIRGYWKCDICGKQYGKVSTPAEMPELTKG